jgi:energy-coupling factor transport system substrate-specific component
LTETVTFVSGFVFGPMAGFVTGASIIIISDMAMLPGAWTPFIAAIIGLIGVCASLIRKEVEKPSLRIMGISAVALTPMSETLQNTWVAVFYNVPISVAVMAGISSLITALVNNIILFTTLGLRTIRIILESALRCN